MPFLPAVLELVRESTKLAEGWEAGVVRANGGTSVARRAPAPTTTAASERHPGVSEHALLDLQRTAGNQAVTQLIQRRAAGSPLPAGASAHRVLGSAAAKVRLHHGSAPGLSVPSGSLAVTEGYDIAIASDGPDLDSTEGELLLAHEAVHVAQQTGTGGAISENGAEEEADGAAVAAMTHAPIPRLGRARGPQRFDPAKHQGSLTLAMKNAGFTDKEQQEAYFANWCRDFSQFLVPPVNKVIGTQAATTLISMLSMEKFGRPVTPAQLGMYNPAEHIDNPAGNINADKIQQSNAPIAVAGRGAFKTPAPDTGSANIANAFKLSASGVPAYVDDSKKHVKDEAMSAVKAGRTPEGLRHLGNLSHTVEDLFAHSNWVEAAVGQMLDADSSILGPAVKAEVEKRKKKGQPPVETYAAEVKGIGGKVRPVLMTGTFSGGSAGHDTMISLRSELQNMLTSASPFKDKSSSQKYWGLAIEILQNLDKSAEKKELGPIVAGHVEEIVANAGKALTKATGNLVGTARGYGDKVGLGGVAAAGAKLLNWGANKAVDVGAKAWESVLKGAVAGAVNVMGSHVSLAQVAGYIQRGEEKLAKGWKFLKDAVGELPAFIRNVILPQLEKAEKAFKDGLNNMLTAAWTKGVQALMNAIDGGLKEVDPAESAIYRKLEAMKRDELPKLRDRLLKMLREVAPISGAGLIQELTAMEKLPIRDRAAAMIAFAASPNLKSLLEGMHGADKQALMGVTGDLNETSERIKQIENVPEWARFGGSHSQMAKDHADSPMFGLAFKLANIADGKVIGLLKQAWGDAGPVPELAGNFAAPGKEQKFDKDAMDKDRQKRFLKARDEAEEVITTGHGEKLPGPELAKVADALGEIQAGLRKDIARRSPELGKALEELNQDLRKKTLSQIILQHATLVRELARKWLASESNREVRDHLGKVAPAIDRIVSLLPKTTDGHCDSNETPTDHAKHKGMCAPGESPSKHQKHAGVCEPSETPDQHVKHAYTACKGESLSAHAAHAGPPCPNETQAKHLQHASKDDQAQTEADKNRTGAHFNAQIDELDKHRGKGTREGLHGPGAKATKADLAVANAKTVEERLMASIDQIFGHPFDTTWWYGPTRQYIKEHADVLAQGVLDRNSGKAHSHKH